MTNAKESYEAKILEKLIDNSEQLAVVKTKMTSVEANLERLNTQVGNLSIEVKEINSKLSETKKDIDSKLSQTQKDIDSKLSQTQKDIDSKLSQTQKDIDSRLSEIQKDIDSRLSQSQKDINFKMSGLEDKINKMNEKQNWFFTILAGIGTGILATLYSQPILTALSNFK